MKFTVLWLESAEKELAKIWLDAEDRAEVTSAANDFDRLLRTSPLNVGESRENDRRMLLVRPLGINYSVSTDDRVVRVLHVWRY